MKTLFTILLALSGLTMSSPAQAVAPKISCATAPPMSSYNTGQTSANNVPLYQCYAMGGECNYNFAKPGTAGGWLAACPANISGTNCCRWRPAPTPTPTPLPTQVTCADVTRTPKYINDSSKNNNVPLGQCYLNTVGECLYNFVSPATNTHWNKGCPPAVAGTNCCRWRPTPTPTPAPIKVSCADPTRTPPYIRDSSKNNNVPVGQCYRNTVGECLYNTANPATATGAWNTGCPAAIAGTNCCRWKPTPTPTPTPIPVSCANPNRTPKYINDSTKNNNVPVGQCYLNTVKECLYNTANPATATGAWNTGCPAAIAGANCCRWKIQETPTPPPPCPTGQVLVQTPLNGAVIQQCCSGTGITKFTPHIGTINYQGPYCCTPKAQP